MAAAEAHTHTHGEEVAIAQGPPLGFSRVPEPGSARIEERRLWPGAVGQRLDGPPRASGRTCTRTCRHAEILGASA